nr:hypothetical protein [Tanacetum cinerariifolium]
MSNVSNPQCYSPSSPTSSSTQVLLPVADNPHLDSSLSLAENLIENLTNTLALRGQGMNLRGGSAAGYGGAQNRVGNVNLGQARPSQARPVKCYNCNGGQDNAFDDDVDEQPVQDLALNVDNVFQADDCDTFNSDVDEALTAQTMFMANLSSADPVTDEVGPSYDSDILSKLNFKFVNNMLPEWGRFMTAVKLNRGLRDSNYDQLTFLSQTNNQLRTSSTARNQATVQDGRVVVQNVQGRPNRGQEMNPRGGNTAGYGGAPNRVGNDNQGQARPGQARTADDCDAFDSDVDEAPTAQTMFMANLSYTDPVTDEAEPSYDSDILSAVPDYEHYLHATCAHHEGHVTHDNIQLDHFVDSHADYTSDSHMILYDQYVKDNEVPVLHSGASYVPTESFMMIYNDMCESHDPSISNTSRNTVVKNSLTAELATYKEHVELYEQRAKFELTEREQKINEQLRIVISDRNFKEETLKRELHSIKLQLAS